MPIITLPARKKYGLDVSVRVGEQDCTCWGMEATVCTEDGIRDRVQALSFIDFGMRGRWIESPNCFLYEYAVVGAHMVDCAHRDNCKISSASMHTAV